MGGLETYYGVPSLAEWQRSVLENGSVFHILLNNDRQRKRLECKISRSGGDNGVGNGALPGITDKRSRMAASCSSGDGDKRGSWRKW